MKKQSDVLPIEDKLKIVEKIYTGPVIAAVVLIGVLFVASVAIIVNEVMHNNDDSALYFGILFFAGLFGTLIVWCYYLHAEKTCESVKRDWDASEK